MPIGSPNLREGRHVPPPGSLVITMGSGLEADSEPSPVGSADGPVSQRRAVVVLGMHRSGTSALARMLSLLGLALPKNPMGPSRGNELGHWGESDPIRWLHQELLQSAGSSWDDVSPFPAPWLETNAADEYRTRLASVLSDEYPGSDPFVVKDPRICRLLPLWTRVLDDLGVDAGFLLALRNPLEVAASLAHRDGFGHSKGLLLWLRHTLDAERETRDQQRLLVSYAELLRDWRATADEISARLDLEWTRTGHGASAAIDRGLSAEQRHHEFSIDELSARDDVVAWVQEVYAVLLEACDSKKAPDAERLDAVNAALADADLAYGEVLAESRLETAELGDRLDRERRRFETERADLEDELGEQEAERAGLEAVVRGLTEQVRAKGEGDSVRESRIEELSARVEADEAELSDATAKIEEREATTKALAAELARLEGQSQQAAERIEELRGEAETRESAARQREADLRQEITELRRELRETNQAIAGLRDSGLRQRFRRRSRSARQLGSWLVNPRSAGRPRNVREFLVLRRSGLFDSAGYLRRNPDVAAAGMNPLMHYIEHGARTGRNPNAWFDTAAYFGQHPGLRDSGVNPLYHYHRSGGSREAVASRGPLPPTLASPDWTSDGEPDQPAAPEPPARVVEAARLRLEAKPLTVSVVVPTHNRASVLPGRAALGARAVAPAARGDRLRRREHRRDGTMLRTEFGAEIETGAAAPSPQRRAARDVRRPQRGPAGAGGDLVAYLDSDNTWARDFLLLDGVGARGARRRRHRLLRHRASTGRRGTPRDRQFDGTTATLLLSRNFIDLNAFVHRRRLYDQLGGFDESLKRLVDWDLVLRYTRRYPPVAVPSALVNYYGGEDESRVTTAAGLRAERRDRARAASPTSGSTRADARSGSATSSGITRPCRRPSSSTRSASSRGGYDVNVYYHTEPDRAAALDFAVPTYRVDDADDLAALDARARRTMLHSHFAYPAATRLAWPAAQAAGFPSRSRSTPSTSSIEKNIERNRIDEMTADPLCARVFAIGEFHRDFLIERGVPPGEDLDRQTRGDAPRAPHREASSERLVATAARWSPPSRGSCRRRAYRDLIRAERDPRGRRRGPALRLRPRGGVPRAGRRSSAPIGVALLGALEGRSAGAGARRGRCLRPAVHRWTRTATWTGCRR